jgi:predicted RNase H-like nuclease (RuvC/YqgF family)
MSDEELVKHCMCGCMYLEAECPNCNKVTDADRIEALIVEKKYLLERVMEQDDLIEALTEQLEAARADAKEAEAYAEELGKEIELNEQEACMLENDFIKADKEIDDLKAKLAAAVDWFETIRDRAKGDYMAHTYYLDALAALATIKRREQT